MNRPWSDDRFCSGRYSRPVLRSISTACRCTNVPRRESCPDRRTRWPSRLSEPNASSSANAQSMPPSRAILARRSSTGFTRGCGEKPVGRSTCASAIFSSTAWVMEVGIFAGICCSDSTDGLATAGCFSSSRTSLKTCSSWLEKSRSAFSASSTEMSPRPISASV